MLDCQDDGGEREREKVLRWVFFFMHADTALLWERCR